MIKKDAIYNWDQREKYAFTHIKQVISHAPTLYSLDFSKDFLLYSFDSNTSLAVILSQKENQGNMWPISFMIVGLQESKLNYPTIDKKSYVVSKAEKNFRLYLLKIHVIIFVPHAVVRSLFMQQELGEKRGKWIPILQEYDL